MIVNDDKYAPVCAGVRSNPLAIYLRNNANRNRGNLNYTPRNLITSYYQWVVIRLSGRFGLVSFWRPNPDRL